MKNHRMEIKKLIPTIGNEFPESDASLQITGLKCCILTQNYKGRIIRAPTVKKTHSNSGVIYFLVTWS